MTEGNEAKKQFMDFINSAVRLGANHTIYTPEVLSHYLTHGIPDHNLDPAEMQAFEKLGKYLYENSFDKAITSDRDGNSLSDTMATSWKDNFLYSLNQGLDEMEMSQLWPAQIIKLRLLYLVFGNSIDLPAIIRSSIANFQTAVKEEIEIFKVIEATIAERKRQTQGRTYAIVVPSPPAIKRPEPMHVAEAAMAFLDNLPEDFIDQILGLVGGHLPIGHITSILN